MLVSDACDDDDGGAAAATAGCHRRRRATGAGFHRCTPAPGSLAAAVLFANRSGVPLRLDNADNEGKDTHCHAVTCIACRSFAAQDEKRSGVEATAFARKRNDAQSVP